MFLDFIVVIFNGNNLRANIGQAFGNQEKYSGIAGNRGLNHGNCRLKVVAMYINSKRSHLTVCQYPKIQVTSNEINVAKAMDDLLS
jgi:exo-beta-1,3-glucanase (GH17 family)